MKNKIIIIFTILIFNIVNAQQIVDVSEFTNKSSGISNTYYKDINNIYTNYIGTWENITGNKTFRVTLWKEVQVKYSGINVYREEKHGKFMMIQNAGQSNETILYRSDKDFIYGGTWIDVMQYTPTSSDGFGGSIWDNCIPIDGDYKWGRLRFIMNYNTSPITAQWIVKELPGMHLSNEPPFTIPTNLILTKVN